MRKTSAVAASLYEDLESLVRGQVEPEALLAPVRVLEQDVHGRSHHRDPARGETTHRIAPLDVLDLHDLGTPVGEQCRGGGNERVLRDLEDANALHDGSHRTPRTGTLE